MRLKEYIEEGKTDFWKSHADYFIRELDNNSYEVAVFKRGDTPNAVYKCTEKTCDCPSKKACIHQKVLKDWIKADKPSPFGEKPKMEVISRLKKMGIKI